MAKTQTQTKPASLAAFLEEVEAAADILPKLQTPSGRETPFHYRLRCVSNDFKEIEYADPNKGGAKSTAWIVPVEVLDGNGGSDIGSTCGLFISADPTHGLTRNFKTVFNAAGGDMKGRIFDLAAEIYSHEKFGPTRGYRCRLVEDENED